MLGGAQLGRDPGIPQTTKQKVAAIVKYVDTNDDKRMEVHEVKVLVAAISGLSVEDISNEHPEATPPLCICNLCLPVHIIL